MNAPKTFIGVGDLFDTVSRVATGAALLLLAVAVGLVVRGRRPVVRRATGTSLRPATIGRRWLIGIAVAAAVAVAGLGGIRSFEAVSATFGSPLVPLTADGMIIACTALRLAALTRGWRLPGSLATTYLFIGGTVWLNIAAAHGWTDAVAHALAPVSYAVLVEMLAHLLRLHLRLAQPSKPRVTALTWFTSPIVTTRVWLHLARTGGQDPVAARALVQQLIRMSSRLQTVCPSQPLRGWSPFDRPMPPAPQPCRRSATDCCPPTRSRPSCQPTKPSSRRVHCSPWSTVQHSGAPPPTRRCTAVHPTQCTPVHPNQCTPTAPPTAPSAHRVNPH